jgi:hypothetical protein
MAIGVGRRLGNRALDGSGQGAPARRAQATKDHHDYIYDFGDGWEHRLAVTDVRATSAAKETGPPEGCGGTRPFEL